jgi:AcrR family transcriptional regulator
MARPVNADAEATRGRVLRSALTLFAQRGPDGTSIREVARAAGVSLAMVHHYFGSKEALLDACIGSMYDELGQMRVGLEAAFASGGSPAVLLERAVAESLRFACEHRVAVQLLLRSAIAAGRVTPRGRELLLALLEHSAGALGAVLGRPALALRLPLQSLVFLVARYAVQDPTELAMVIGGEAGATAPYAAVERHLTDVAIAVFGLRELAS